MLMTCQIQSKEYHHPNSEVLKNYKPVQTMKIVPHTTSLGNPELSCQRIEYYHQFNPVLFRIRAGQIPYTCLNVYNSATGGVAMLRRHCSGQEWGMC